MKAFALIGAAVAQLLVVPQQSLQALAFENVPNMVSTLPMTPVPKPFFMLMNLAGSCPSDESMIKQAEGFRSKVYKDTKGIKTICYGYNLERGNARSDIQKVGANYDQVMSGAQSLSQSQCTKLLQSELNKARSAARGIFGTLKCSCAQAVATDMTYNLGSGGISAFHNFIAAMKAGDWTRAQQEGRNSLWCRQVGGRCSRDMGYIAKC